jgi:CHAD domain-containing protein
VFRVWGPKAEEPPDPVVAALDRRARLREVISASIAAGVAALVEQDPGIRLGGDSEHVHKARVATRRLRSDLRTFRPVLDRGWVGRMREELRWVGAALGAVRDADVLLEELRSQGASLPKLDAPAAEALLAQLSSSGRRSTNGS